MSCHFVSNPSNLNAKLHGVVPGVAIISPITPPPSKVPPRKVDENITTAGGGEGNVPGSYRYLYSNKPFDVMPETNEPPFIEFSADMLLIGTPSSNENYGMQFIIAGNGEASGQIGLDIGFQSGTSGDFAQKRISIKTVNFPAGAGVHGEQYYVVNTAAKMNPNQKVNIAIKLVKWKMSRTI